MQRSGPKTSSACSRYGRTSPLVQPARASVARPESLQVTFGKEARRARSSRQGSRQRGGDRRLAKVVEHERRLRHASTSSTRPEADRGSRRCRRSGRVRRGAARLLGRVRVDDRLVRTSLQQPAHADDERLVGERRRAAARRRLRGGPVRRRRSRVRAAERPPSTQRTSSSASSSRQSAWTKTAPARSYRPRIDVFGAEAATKRSAPSSSQS